jgi:3-oxoacyl-[acyl-carrier protein] reductase
MGSLEGKVAIVTGGARGIGRAICLKLAEMGADIVVNDVSDNASVRDLLTEIGKAGCQGIFVKADVSRSDQAKDLVEKVVGEMGRVDILVNNAGITRDNLILRMSEEEWDTVLAVNLKGCFNCTQAVSRQMIKQRSGVIINISSVVGIVGNAGQANYSASKAGVIGLTKAVAQELASRGVRVNAVAPGFIDTEMTRQLPEDYREELKKRIPLGFFGQPEDVAKVVAFLAGDEASYITGEVIKIDGGLFT